MLLLLVLVLLAGYSIAQCRLGLRAGAGFTTVAITNLPSEFESDFERRFAYQGGVTLRYNVSKKWNLNTEIIYALKGHKINESGAAPANQLNFHYLSLPIMADYQVFPKLYLGIGPELSYRLGLSIKEGEPSLPLEKIWDRKWDFGLNAEVKFYPTDQFYTSLRYTHGLTNLISTTFVDLNGEPLEPTIKHQNRVLQFSVGYEFSCNKK